MIYFNPYTRQFSTDKDTTSPNTQAPTSGNQSNEDTSSGDSGTSTPQKKKGGFWRNMGNSVASRIPFTNRWVERKKDQAWGNTTLGQFGISRGYLNESRDYLKDKFGDSFKNGGLRGVGNQLRGMIMGPPAGKGTQAPKSGNKK